MTHLAHRVRRMADAIAAMPSDQKLTRNQELAQHLAGLAALLWEHGDAAFARAADWANTGLVSGGGSGGGSGRGPSRPTEAQALAVELAEPGKQRDQLLEDQAIASYYRWLQFYRAHITELAGPMAKILREVCNVSRRDIDPHPGTKTIVDPHTGKENRVPVCAEYFCDDGAPAPVHGRCEPCHKWRARWVENHPGSTIAEAPVVPREVIDRRAVRRRRQPAA